MPDRREHTEIKDRTVKVVEQEQEKNRVEADSEEFSYTPGESSMGTAEAEGAGKTGAVYLKNHACMGTAATVSRKYADPGLKLEKLPHFSFGIPRAEQGFFWIHRRTGNVPNK